MLRKLSEFFLLIFISSHLLAADKVVLQLKWEHQFQFAGYYAAQWQGFYKDAGLDVKIKSAITADKKIINPVLELSNGNAQFAIGGLDILVNEDQDIDPVVLASFFQRTPTAVFSLKKTDISDLAKLAKLRIAATKSDFSKTEIEALFRSHGYDLKKINFVNQPVTIETLINNKADAIITYDISANFSAKEKNIELNKLSPADLSLGFYGDTLYTLQNYAKTHPQIVNKFTQASKKGWLYALQHKQEMAKKIADEFPRHLVKYADPYAYNLYFSKYINEFIQYPKKPLGNINKDRWLNMNERMRALGLVRSHLNDNFFYVAPENEESDSLKLFFYLLTFALFLPITLLLWYRRYQKLTIVALLLATFLCEVQVEQVLVKEKKLTEKENAAQKLNSVSAKLQGHLQTNLSMLTGFAAYISAMPDLSENDFKRYAQALFKKEPMLINFAAAKNLVVNYIYPVSGNEKALGLNYQKIPEQYARVMQVINTGQMQMAGPVNLVQGGTAFIGRAPIFLEDGKLWGVISAPLDAQLLFKFSEIEKTSNNLKIAIRTFDALGNEGPVFFGDASVFTDPERLEHIFSVGGDSWHIAAIPLKISKALPTNIYMLRIYFLIAGVLLSLFAWFRFQQESDKKKLELEIKDDKILLESVGRVAKIGGWKLSNNFKFTKWSEQSSLALGKPKTFIPETLTDLEYEFAAEDYLSWTEKIEKTLETYEPFDIKLQLITEDKRPIWVRIMCDGEKIDNGTGITGTIQDITNKILSAQRIEYQASYDSLTDLPNRLLYHDRLNLAIKNAHRNKLKLAVLFIDLDRFKPINDNHGHQAGDKVLIETASRLKKLVRESDTVSRLSGDEFSIILNNISQNHHVANLAEQIYKKMQEPFQLENAAVHLGASIGIALYPNDAICADSLLKKADQAMYEVKASGRNGYQFYTREIQQKSEYRHELLNNLIEAFNNGELKPYFQPIIDLKTNKITKCETLARWQQDNGSFVPTIEFINLAEESGLINKIDLFMLQESGKSLLEIGSNIELSINVSPRLFQTRDNALEKWTASIKEISKSIKITVEITERLLTEDSDKALLVLNELKSFGVKIAIDDFGTGYSSLNYLMKFPVDIIKIDRSFIKQIGVEPSSEVLIETIFAMANRLGIQVIAEGIETKAQLDYVKKNNCNYTQGYLIGKPMSKENFDTFLKKN